MSNPKISVIVPIYNEEKYLRECLESIRQQTLKDMKVICVDDGSTDDSSLIMDEFAKKDSRFKVIHKAHSGFGSSVNLGLSAAVGEYVGIVRGADFINSKMYQTLYDSSFGGTAEIVMSGFFDCYEQLGNDPYIIRNESGDAIPDLDTPASLSEMPQVLSSYPSVWSAIYRRDFLHDQGLLMIKGREDTLVEEPFFIETMCKAKKIFWMKEPLYFYRHNDQTNLPSDAIETTAADLIPPLKRMMDDLDIIEKTPSLFDNVLYSLYSRVCTFLRDTLSEYDYWNNSEIVCEYAKKIMRRLDPDIVREKLGISDQKTYLEFSSPLKALYAKQPKILIYNWLPFDNPWGWGGGVTIYCKNVIETLLKEYPNVQIFFLSSGFAYKATTAEIFYRKIDNVYGDNVRQFEIVNSPVPADQRNIYNNPLIALENKNLKNVFKKFLDQFGPFETIHFQNIEGLSFDVLDLKKDFPETKFIYSLHNYVPVCVTGSYYMRHKHCNCAPAHTGEDCFACVHEDIETDFAQKTYERGFVGVDKTQCVSKSYFCRKLGFERLDQTVYGDKILQFARMATKKINENCDHILAVSKRVYDIAASEGFDKNKMIVSYIGTEVAERQVRHSLAEKKNGLKIVFLGSDLNYEEKGYPWLLDSLEQLEPQYAKKIDLVLTTRTEEHAEIYTMCQNFRSVKVIPGYIHDDLEWILNDCDLGIVPVLWEDNLPQIAIEMVAYGVPILASSSGGASELCDSSLFKFQSGDTKNFLDKLVHFLNNPDDLNEYWVHHFGLVTMSDHIEEIAALYGIDQDQSAIELSPEDYSYLLKEHDFLEKGFSLEGAEPIIEYREINTFPERDKMQEQINDLQYVIDETRNSRSYKLAMTLTAPVRKRRERKRAE